MYKEIAKLILYRDLGEDSILLKLSGIFRDYELDLAEKENLTSRIYEQMKALLDLSTQYGFDKNLWHNYLTYLLVNNENAFSMACEIVGPVEGSINPVALNDFSIFKELFDYDLDKIDEALGVNGLALLKNYKNVNEHSKMFNKRIRDRICETSRRLAAAADEHTFMDIMTAFYKDFGVGKLGLHKAFRV